MNGLVNRGDFSNIQDSDLARIDNAWLAIRDGKVEDFGKGQIPGFFSDYGVVDAKGSLVTPGLVDCHTHPMFGGDRSHEFVKRLDGASYTEIAEAGGGIKYTVSQTREASLEDLTEIAYKNIKRFLSNGVTTVEVKSGYGLSVEEELKMLLAYKDLKEKRSRRLKLLVWLFMLYTMESPKKNLLRK